MLRAALVGLLLVTLMPAAPFGSTPGARAQAISRTEPSPDSRPPSRMQKISKRTKETLAQLKLKLTVHQQRWLECRREARVQRIAGRKTRKFLDACMADSWR